MISYKINFFLQNKNFVILIMLNDLYILPRWRNWRMGCLVYVECMGRREGKRLLLRLGVDERIILKWFLNKCNGMDWTIWLMLGTTSRLLWRW